MTGSFKGTLCTLCLCDLREMLIFLGKTFEVQRMPRTYLVLGGDTHLKPAETEYSLCTYEQSFPRIDY